MNKKVIVIGLVQQEWQVQFVCNKRVTRWSCLKSKYCREGQIRVCLNKKKTEGETQYVR